MGRFDWVNPPPVWSGDAASLTLETGPETDWWTESFYGFTHASGHAFVADAPDSFTLSARVRAGYEANYDQAGLMLLGPGRAWLKAGIEFTGGAMHFSVVVSTPRSDWSMIPLDAGPDLALRVRLTRYAESVGVQFAAGDAGWRLARVASYPGGACRAGAMACSPSRAGLRARIDGITIGPPQERETLGA